MAQSNRSLAGDRGRNLLIALGGTYVALALGYPFVSDTSLEIDLVILLLVGGPGLVLLVGGYRLPRSDIRPEVYAAVVKWCLGGIGVMLALLALVELATGLRDPIQNLLILTALGGLAGYAAGVRDARAKSRELELRETVEQLRTANERLEQFAYAASHDLQEPLRMVSSYLRLLDSRYGDELDAEAQEFIDYAVDGADRMRAMVDSLHEYSQISTDGTPLEPTDTDAVLEDVLDDLQLRIEETGATITSGDLPTVRGDPIQLRLVFRNLLTNAIEYSGDEPPRIHVDAERVDDCWQFSVADEGIGIDPEYQDRVFEVFERLHAGGESETDGSGLGLALCERIVERHGGDIWVESSPGEEAVFYFTVPGTDDRSRTPVARGERADAEPQTP